MHPHDPGCNRREFLRRAGVSGGAALALGALGWWRHDPVGPPPPSMANSTFSYPDYRITGLGPRLSVVTGGDRAACARKAIELLGGIAAFISKGDRVLLKVNAAFALPPLLCATTHPDLLAAVTKLSFDAGAAQVRVTDNSINDPSSCFRLTGISAAAETSGAELVLPHERFFRPLTVPGARLLRNWPVLAEPFKGVTKVIGLSPVKDHHRSGASLSLKNWYGLLGGRRNLFHQDIHTIICELGQMIRPTLVLLDGVQAMTSNGPTGGSVSDLAETRTMIAATDLVAADTVGVRLLGREPSSMAYLALAEAAGLGTTDVDSLKPMRREA